MSECDLLKNTAAGVTSGGEVTRRLFVRGGVATLVLSFLSGCVAGSDEPESDSPVPTEGSGASVTGPPVLGPVVWTTAIAPGTNEPVAPVSQFTVDAETLYAAFPVERLAANTVIRATWSLNGEAIDGVGAELTTPRDQVGGWLEFHLQRTSEEPWPDGEYGIVLSTQEVLIANGSVNVVRNAQ